MVKNMEDEEKEIPPEEKGLGLKEVLDEMKDAGIEGALVRNDGVMVYSTMPLDEGGAKLISSFGNVLDAMLKSVGDTQREVEVSLNRKFLVMIPIRTHVLCGMLSNRDKKENLRGFADRIKLII